MKILIALFTICFPVALIAQTDTSHPVRTDTLRIAPTTTLPPVTGADTIPVINHTVDTSLRIINLNPFFSLHVDSTLNYQFEVNRESGKYFWYLRNAPVGIRINKNNGLLSFRAERSYFLSGRLKYDQHYKVQLGIQSLVDPSEKVDTSFTIVFYNTEIIPSILKPGVSGTIWVEEGDTLRFPVFCETGSFPIESILTQTNIPIGSFETVARCNGYFTWVPGYDFVRESDSAKVRVVTTRFIGSTKFLQHDTATIRIIVRNGVNYPLVREQYEQLVNDFNVYILRLKYTFLSLDKTIKKTKRTRTAFDLTAAGTALTGTVLTTSSDAGNKRTGAIMPGIGLTLTPIKEATAPNRNAEQNQATLVRSSIKRLEYILQDNRMVSGRDPDLPLKMAKLKEELKQSQLQLIDVPIDITNDMGQAELDRYFNSPKVNKKYRLRKKK